MYFQTLDNDTLDASEKILSNKLQHLYEDLIKCSAEQDWNSKDLELERLMIEANRIKEMANQFSHQKKYRINFDEAQNMYKSIAQLLHINCPLELKCAHRIELKSNHKTSLLQEIIFQIVTQSSNDNTAQRFFIEDRKIIDRIFPLIIRFANYEKLNDEKEIVDPEYQNQTYIRDAISLLLNLINQNQQVLFAKHSLFSAIFKLAKYNQGQIIEQKSDTATSIRRNSISVIIELCECETNNEQFIHEFNCIKILTEANSTAGGSRDYDTFVILHSRALINTLLQKIRGKQNHNPQPGLLKT
ncbi:MAG: hypothetical protein EZS28_046005, partial [Streblomastix strix]